MAEDLTKHGRTPRLSARESQRERYVDALDEYEQAARALLDAWTPGTVYGYPAHLPSFDEHVEAVTEWLKTERDPKRGR